MAAHARAAGAEVVTVAGVVAIGADDLAAAGFSRAFSLVGIAVDGADARARATELLEIRTADAVAW